MNYPSKLIENAVAEMARLPGIGKKTALRLVLNLLRAEETQTDELARALLDMRHNVRYCRACHNIADDDLCGICTSHRRDRSLLCVVEDTRDVMAIENTAQYRGLYHVLGGVISPIEGIGPNDLEISSLLGRVAPPTDAVGEPDPSEPGVQEVILALSPTMEGDTTAFYLAKKIRPYGVKVSTIARGVPVGGNLEYADEITLGRSIVHRTAAE